MAMRERADLPKTGGARYAVGGRLVAPVPYRALADAVVALHLGFVLFVVLGALLVARWPRVAWAHVPAALWGAAVELAGWTCPLTPLENRLRARGGAGGYSGGFVDHWVLPVLYPEALTRPTQVALGVLALAVNVALYAWVIRRRSRVVGTDRVRRGRSARRRPGGSPPSPPGSCPRRADARGRDPESLPSASSHLARSRAFGYAKGAMRARGGRPPDPERRKAPPAGGAIDRRAVERDWTARGFSCGLWTDPPGQVWEDFTHATDELFMLVDGEVELELAGRAFRPRPGEEILIPAGARHSVRNRGRTTSHWLYGYRAR
jgi:mannose-6-phosphate isomerase-like protein (cupin superfamily)